MDREEFIWIAVLIYTKPKEFDRIIRNMTKEEFLEYNRERYLFIKEQKLVWKEKRLH